MSRGSQIISTPRSVSVRISRPAPCFRLIAACGSCQSTNGLPPSLRSFSRRAASSGSSGGANGSLSMTTSDSASPGTSTPSQKLALPSSTALPSARKRISNSLLEPSPWTSSG